MDTRSAEVATQLEVLCARYGHDYFRGSWWPDEAELVRAGVAVTRFVQRPGEPVCVGIGCLHWVRAEGTTINVAWSVGPATARQFEAAARRYTLNRARNIKSIVPMQALAWRLLAADVVKASDALFSSVRAFCAWSLDEERRQAVCCASRKLRAEVSASDAAYCDGCAAELFNHVFESMRKHFCHRCVGQRRGLAVTLRRPLEQLEQMLAC